jgi:hypothetical protein
MSPPSVLLFPRDVCAPAGKLAPSIMSDAMLDIERPSSAERRGAERSRERRVCGRSAGSWQRASRAGAAPRHRGGATDGQAASRGGSTRVCCATPLRASPCLSPHLAPASGGAASLFRSPASAARPEHKDGHISSTSQLGLAVSVVRQHPRCEAVRASRLGSAHPRSAAPQQTHQLCSIRQLHALPRQGSAPCRRSSAVLMCARVRRSCSAEAEGHGRHTSAKRRGSPAAEEHGRRRVELSPALRAGRALKRRSSAACLACLLTTSPSTVTLSTLLLRLRP